MRALTSTVLAVWSLAASGCGGAGEAVLPVQRADRQELAARMDAVCSDINAASDNDGDLNQSIEALSSPRLQASLRELDEVKPEAQYQRDFDNFKDDVREMVAIVTDSDATTSEEQLAVVFELVGPGQRVVKVAKRMGARRCL